ncbi:MAG TPA: GMC family oxidoreductase [Candidatus Solibacter sp.]|nr:GMC family oxidoreductase [Candidatus Solibacter sp.]
MAQVKASPKTYDVIVVGSGAGGGIAAHVLALAGAKICMLEAGAFYDCTKQSDMFKWDYNAPHRAAGTREKPFGYYDATLEGGWQVPGEPYTTAPGSDFMWWRARMLGGRTNHYGRISLRMGPYDFKPYSRDGKGFDWPITYEDLAPYYDKAEELIGVFGTQEGLENTPDGKFQPAPAPRGYERIIKKSCDKLKIPCIPSRLSILTRPLNGRAACHYCGQCGRACGVNANFNSPGVHIFPAMKTGNLELRTDAMVREVLVGPDGMATGVSYIDRKTRQEIAVKANVVVLAASCCETARILLNSKNSHFPDGVANSTGLVGKYIMDTVGASVGGYLPILEDLPPQNEDGVGGMHMYMPWWQYQQQKAGKLPFARGYHIEIGGGRDMPGAGVLEGSERILGGGYGVDLKRNLRKIYGANIDFAGRGEMIPNENSYCEIDPNVVDKWGIPVLRFHFKWSDDEILQAKHMQETFQEIIIAAGGRVTYSAGADSNWGIARGGEIIHEVGATKMGDNPKTSVLNQYCQAWDCKNLFITDAAPFASNADKNPTLSITALGWRTSEYIYDQVKKRNLAVSGGGEIRGNK